MFLTATYTCTIHRRKHEIAISGGEKELFSGGQRAIPRLRAARYLGANSIPHPPNWPNISQSDASEQFPAVPRSSAAGRKWAPRVTKIQHLAGRGQCHCHVSSGPQPGPSTHCATLYFMSPASCPHPRPLAVFVGRQETVLLILNVSY